MVVGSPEGTSLATGVSQPSGVRTCSNRRSGAVARRLHVIDAWQRGRAAICRRGDYATDNAEMQEKCVFVVDDLFAVRDLLAAQVSNSRG